jgi:hypothetical protein
MSGAALSSLIGARPDSIPALCSPLAPATGSSAPKGAAGLFEMKGGSLLKSLETDPRHAAFLKKMRLPL